MYGLLPYKSNFHYVFGLLDFFFFFFGGGGGGGVS